MQQHGDAIGSELHVELHKTRARLDGGGYPFQGVFRVTAGISPMGDELWCLHASILSAVEPEKMYTLPAGLGNVFVMF